MIQDPAAIERAVKNLASLPTRRHELLDDADVVPVKPLKIRPVRKRLKEFVIKIPRFISPQKPVSTPSQRVFKSLMVCPLTVAELAARTGLGRRQIYPALQDLFARRLIEPVGRAAKDEKSRSAVLWGPV